MREKERTGVIRGMILPEIVPEMMFLEDCPAMRETGSTLLCPVLPLHARRSACLFFMPWPPRGSTGMPVFPAFRSGEPRPRNQKESP